MLHTKYMDQWEGYLEAPLERRCHNRFKVKHEIYLVSNQSKKVFGFLHDISAGGISFEYIPTCKDQIDTREMNINLDGCNLHFYRLRAKCIFDFEIEEAYYSSVKMRRRGVQFVGLTNEQRLSLKWFIQNIAIEQSNNDHLNFIPGYSPMH